MNKNTDIKNLKTAKRYANALIEANKNSIDEIIGDLALIDEVIFKNDDFRAFFFHPVISLSDKKETIESTLKDKINPTTFNFIETLLDEGRFNIFTTIFEVYKQLADAVKNKQRIEVVSAVDIDSDIKKRLEEKLSQKLNKEIILNCSKDEKIIGGLVIKLDDKVVDLSLSAKFASLIENN